MKTRKNILKISFFTFILIAAFIFIYWYTSADRCVSYDVDQTIREQFGSNKDYDMCVNYYGATIFENHENALLRARKDYGNVLVAVQAKYNLQTIRDDNYEKYMIYVSKLDDMNFTNEMQELTDFLEIYDNGMKRAKVSIGCIFIKTFRVIDTITGYDNKDTYDYIILEDPDTNEPMMINVSLSLKEQLEEGKSYYFYFKNSEDYTKSYSDYENLFEKLKIVKVEEAKSKGDYIFENGCK